MSLRTLKFDDASARLPTELAIADRVERMTENLNDALAEAFRNGLAMQVAIHTPENENIPVVIARLLKPLHV